MSGNTSANMDGPFSKQRAIFESTRLSFCQAIAFVWMMVLCLNVAWCVGTSVTLARVVTTQFYNVHFRVRGDDNQYIEFCYRRSDRDALGSFGSLAVRVDNYPANIPGLAGKLNLQVRRADVQPYTKDRSEYQLPEPAASSPWQRGEIVSALQQTIDRVVESSPSVKLSFVMVPLRFPQDLWEEVRPAMQKHMLSSSGIADSLNESMAAVMMREVTGSAFFKELNAMLRQRGYVVDPSRTPLSELLMVRRSFVGKPWRDLAKENDLGLDNVVIGYNLNKLH